MKHWNVFYITFLMLNNVVVFDMNNAIDNQEEQSTFKLALLKYHCTVNTQYEDSTRTLTPELQLHILHHVPIEQICNPIPLVWFGSELFLHNTGVRSAHFNQDETHVLTASNDHTDLVYDLASGTEQQRLLHDPGVRSACFNQDETHILIASNSHIAPLCDVSSGTEQQHPLHDTGVRLTRFNKDKTCMFIVLNDKTVHLLQKYTSWTAEQQLLYKILFTWLLVQKTSKSINSIHDFITTTRITEDIDSNHIAEIWQSFPVPVQTDIWKKIKLFIDRYGK